jgi:hypothetical protein
VSLDSTNTSRVADHWSSDPTLGLPHEGAGSVVLRLTGEVGHAELERFVQHAEAWSLEAADGVVTRKRLLNVLVEALENLRMHTDPSLAHTSFAVLKADEQAFTLLIGNAMPSATAAVMNHRIEVLNAMSEADLKQHYLLLLGNSGRTDRGGAGLGLITIARKSARPLNVTSRVRDEATRYLILEARILRDA